MERSTPRVPLLSHPLATVFTLVDNNYGRIRYYRRWVIRLSSLVLSLTPIPGVLLLGLFRTSQVMWRITYFFRPTAHSPSQHLPLRSCDISIRGLPIHEYVPFHIKLHYFYLNWLIILKEFNDALWIKYELHLLPRLDDPIKSSPLELWSVLYLSRTRCIVQCMFSSLEPRLFNCILQGLISW
jgi:hypothetical protein